MTDVFSKQKRSEIMSLVRSTGNKCTERVLARFFRDHGIRGWRRNYPLFGKPDFVFPKQRLAVFVDGCFWHGCPKHGSLPSTNRLYWLKKLSRNKSRDRLVAKALRTSGWRVMHVWEHALSKRDERLLAARFKRMTIPRSPLFPGSRAPFERPKPGYSPPRSLPGARNPC